MDFFRQVSLSDIESSVLLLGPRMSGKTHLLSKFKNAVHYDLLDVELELRYKSHPRIFYQEIESLPEGSLVVIDEIQKVPQLLNYVQMGIEKLGLRFLLSGSSARKLKREGVNLLAGRALLYYLHPLSVDELNDEYPVSKMLEYGSIPKIVTLLIDGKAEEAKRLLYTYRQVYLQLEIQQEAITRNLGNFTKFLDVAAQFNAQQIVYQNIASSGQIPRSTVSNYFEILEDTLIGTRLWEFQKSEKDKNKPKLYFFDCGVVRAIQNRLEDPPTPTELGHLFETFIFLELRKIRDYHNKPYTFSYWNKGQEIDFIIEKNKQIVMAIECKSSLIRKTPNFERFHKEHPDVPVFIAGLTEERERKISEKVIILPWKNILEKFKHL
jgi:uncharacterized protein